ncbi:unnamed protein product, partial [Didymodactylos carnosus]
QHQIELYIEDNLKPFKISQKLANKYKFSTTILDTNRVLTIQQPLEQYDIKTNTTYYNERKLFHLLDNINEYDFAHKYSIFNYQFMHSYFNCFTTKQLFLRFLFYITACLDQNVSEIRYLLSIYEMLNDLLDKNPDNYSIEIVSRLLPMLNNQNAQQITQLLKQCDEHSLKHSALISPYYQSQLHSPWNNYLSKLSINKYIYTITSDDDNLYLVSNEQIISINIGLYELKQKYEISYEKTSDNTSPTAMFRSSY